MTLLPGTKRKERLTPIDDAVDVWMAQGVEIARGAVRTAARDKVEAHEGHVVDRRADLATLVELADGVG